MMPKPQQNKKSKSTKGNSQNDKPKVDRQPRKKVADDPLKEAKYIRRRQKIMTKRQMANNVQYDATTAPEVQGIPFANARMTYDVPIEEDAISAVAASVVSFALSRGWQEYTSQPSDPVQAYRWISLLLGKAAQNVVPASATGPLWLAMIVQALVQKNIPSRGGSVSYSATLDLPDNYPTGISADRDIGPLVYSRHLNFGQKTSTLINGYFYTINVNIAYDETQAEKAYTSLYNFLARQAPGPMHKKVNLNDPNQMTNNPSAFAVPCLKAGNGDAGTGGVFSTTSLEVPIKSPLFSCFRKDPGANGDPGRAPNFTAAKGGDGYTLSGLMIQSLNPDQVDFKTPMRFKCVDFMEYLEVLCLWVSKVQQKWVDDADHNSVDYLDIQCPLTLQEVALLLRSNVMTAHSGSQHYGQSLYPRVPSSANSNEFCAFVAGFGTCAYNAPAMRIPRTLKENIQGNTSRVNYGSRGGEKQPVYYISILGKYFYDELSIKDFCYVVPAQEGTQTILSFKDPSSFDAKQKKNVSAEDPINLIDGTTASEYVAINDPSALARLNVLWNNWIEKIINYTTPLATNTNDGGVNVLRTTGMTHHWYLVEKEPSTTLPTFYQQREEKNIMLRNSPYTSRRLEATTNQSKFMPGVWEGIVSKLIKPINLIKPAANYGAQTGYTAYAGICGELNTIVSGEGDAGGMTLAEMHEVYAASLVKDKFGAPSEFEIALNALDGKGNAGILSSLAGAFLGPGVGGLVDSLGLP